MKSNVNKNLPQISHENQCVKHRFDIFIYRKNKGVSLVVAMIFIPIMMLLAAFMTEPIVQSYRAAAADQKRMLAKAIAENLFEQALLDTKDLPTGANATGCLGESTTQGGTPEGCTYEVDYGFGKATGQWWVYGQPQTDEEHMIDGYYYVPSVGTGTAGGDYCSSADPVFDAVTLEAALKSLESIPTDITLSSDAANWPCNWNKLKEGQSVTIPLYSENIEGEVHNIGLADLELRVRPPCNPTADTTRTDIYAGEICDDDDRYLLAGDAEILGDTVIVTWDITGKEGSSDGANIYLTGIKLLGIRNSIFSVNAINNYETSCMPNTLCQTSITLDQDKTFPQLPVSSYLEDLYKPNLRLMVIHPLKDSGGNKVPYLEYQFRTNATGIGVTPISNSSKIVKVEVMVDGGYTETIEKTVSLPTAVTGFVIQQ